MRKLRLFGVAVGCDYSVLALPRKASVIHPRFHREVALWRPTNQCWSTLPVKLMIFIKIEVSNRTVGTILDNQ